MLMIILIKLFLNRTIVKFVKQLFRVQIQKGRKVLLWNQVKSRMEACYSELVLARKSREEAKQSFLACFVLIFLAFPSFFSCIMQQQFFLLCFFFLLLQLLHSRPSLYSDMLYTRLRLRLRLSGAEKS